MAAPAPVAQELEELLAQVAEFHRRALAKVAETYCQEIQQLRAEGASAQLAPTSEEESVIPGIVRGESPRISRPLDIVPSAAPEVPPAKLPDVASAPQLQEKASSKSSSSNSHRLPSNSTPSSPRDFFKAPAGSSVWQKDHKEQDRPDIETPPRRLSVTSVRSSFDSNSPLSPLSPRRGSRRDSRPDVFARRPSLRRPSQVSTHNDKVNAPVSALSVLNEAVAAHTGPEVLPLWRELKNLRDGTPTKMNTVSSNKTRLSRRVSATQEFEIPAEEKENTSRIVKMLSRFVSQPSSGKRIIYETVGLFLIFFDIIWLPLQAFEPPTSLITGFMGWASTLYWTFDIPCSFFVGFVVPSQGIVETRLPKIAKNYARTWLAFDIIVVLIDWVLNCIPVSSSGDGRTSADYMRMGKAVRLLKLLRLLRLVKAQKALADLMEQIQSESALIIVGIIKQLCMIMLFNHVLACSWFAIGSLDPQRQDAWVKEHQLGDKSILYQYFTSLHWSLTQFTPASMEVFPANEVERTFTVIVILLAMCIFSSFISTITNAVAQLRNINSDRNEQFSRLRRYFLENKVSVPLMACIWSCLHKSMASARRRVHDQDITILQTLPMGLRMELAEQVHASTLAVHPFFVSYGELYPQKIIKICKEARSMSLNMSAELFTVETEAENMFFLVDGSMEYYRQKAGNSEESEKAVQVKSVSWAAEPVLWLTWKHMGRLTAMSHCELVLLHAATIHAIMVKGEANFHGISRYARAFARYTKKHPDEVSDICEDSSILRGLAEVAFKNEVQLAGEDRVETSKPVAGQARRASMVKIQAMFRQTSGGPAPCSAKAGERASEVEVIPQRSGGSRDPANKEQRDTAMEELLRQVARNQQLEDDYFSNSSGSCSSSSESSLSDGIG
eukprot:TRINITY_DN11776_c1_g2_i1.p1 TRINITY_DN11776_c1_g2~~TRINITY_DN11776_c1_g2_i1.p1  ORF type:complete len:898 (+),score=167.57 TRINITY_DN11776_c1_g2_i1:20-2713(+)